MVWRAVVVFPFCSFLVLVAAQSTPTSYNPNFKVCNIDGLPPLCRIQGNPDLYGLGVRIGIYTVWWASWFANNFVVSEYDGALDTNAVFLFAIGIVVIANSRLSEITLVDGLILIQFSWGFISTVMTIWGYRTAVYRQEGARGALRFGGWGTYVRLALLSGLAAFNVWFWTSAVYGALCNPRQSCNGTRVFFFGSQSLFSGARIFYLVIAGGLCFHYLALLFSCLSWFVFTTVAPGYSENRTWNLRKQRMHYQCLTQRQFRLINNALCVLNLFCIGWWIGSIERTLQYNSVYGVYGAEIFSAGQLIPLCIGGLGLVKVVFDCRTARKDRQQREKQPQHWACERCLRDHRARECSLTATAPTAFSEIRRTRSALLVAWLPWLMVFLYRPVDDAEVPARYSHRRY